jgi:glycosyltransferase A (GT-A) superfamily protein (DUF2064 family)
LAPTSASTDIAFLVIAEAPRAGISKPSLEPLLGPGGCARLQAALVARAARWAAASGVPYVAFAPGDARDEIAALVPQEARLLAQGEGHRGERLARAFARVSEEHGGPVVVVGTDQPALAGSHAWAAADDLRAGIDVTLGPATAGGYYLLGAQRFDPALFALDGGAWNTGEVMALTLRSLTEAGLSLGLLRSERDLDRPADAAALLADPCAPDDIRQALQAGHVASWRG